MGSLGIQFCESDLVTMFDVVNPALTSSMIPSMIQQWFGDEFLMKWRFLRLIFGFLLAGSISREVVKFQHISDNELIGEFFISWWGLWKLRVSGSSNIGNQTQIWSNLMNLALLESGTTLIQLHESGALEIQRFGNPVLWKSCALGIRRSFCSFFLSIDSSTPNEDKFGLRCVRQICLSLSIEYQMTF